MDGIVRVRLAFLLHGQQKCVAFKYAADETRVIFMALKRISFK